MFGAVLALPRLVVGTAFRTARSALGALESLPRIAGAMEDLRDAIRHVERLGTFAASELPEVVYQLEYVREQLRTIERRLTGEEQSEEDGPDPAGKMAGISRGSPRSG
jgi:hypothetical protein